MIKCAIFDLDGTLVNSMEYWSIVPSEYLKQNGIEVDDPKALSDKFLSMSLLESSKYFIDKYNFNKTVEEVAQEIDKVMEHYYLNFVEVKKGIKPLLELFYKNNVKMAIATATDKFLVEEVLTKLGIRKYFDFIITSTEVGSSKKNPLIYEKCAEHFNAKYEESIIFEDLPYGIISGKSVGFHTVGIYDEPSKHLQDKIKENAELYFEDFSMESIDKIKTTFELNEKKNKKLSTIIISTILALVVCSLLYYRLVPHKLSLVVPARNIESVEILYYENGFHCGKIADEHMDEFKTMLKNATYILTFSNQYKYWSYCEVLIHYQNNSYRGFGGHYLSTLINPRLCFEMNFDIYKATKMLDETTIINCEGNYLDNKIESSKK